jgi:hypothetical protein
MWNIKVNVTADHIANACRTDSHHCMVADAIHERLTWATYVQVDTQSVRFNNRQQGKRYIYLTPPEAQRAIVLFDQGVKIKPFSFTLSRGYLKVRAMSSRRQDRKGRNDRTTLARQRRRRSGRKPQSVPSMYREFGLRTLTR